MTEQKDEVKYANSYHKVQLHVRIPLYLKQFLDRYAEENHTTMSNVINSYVHQLFMEEQIKKEQGDVGSI